MKTKRARKQSADSTKGELTSISRFPMAHRRRNFTGYLLLLSAGLLCIIGSACVRTGTACPEEYAATHPDECDTFTKHQLTHPRFEFPMPPEKPSRDYWLRAGDEMVVRWDEYTIFWNTAEGTCDFSTNPPPSNDDCDVCTYCTARPCHHSTVFRGTEPKLLRFDGFTSQTESSRETLSVTAGCSASGFRFIPEKNTTFQLIKYSINLTPLAETKAFVVESGGSQKVQYELSLLSPATEELVFYKAAVPGDQILEDNFSPNLHITRVRILKGTHWLDPTTGKRQLINASPVHPSRIVLIPKYDGGDIFDNPDYTRCYADESEFGDGDLDLTRCRATREARCSGTAADPESCNQLATPTYLAGFPDLVTWVAEFKTAEGGIIPTLESGEVLAIEFTIVAN